MATRRFTRQSCGYPAVAIRQCTVEPIATVPPSRRRIAIGHSLIFIGALHFLQWLSEKRQFQDSSVFDFRRRDPGPSMFGLSDTCLTRIRTRASLKNKYPLLLQCLISFTRNSLSMLGINGFQQLALPLNPNTAAEVKGFGENEARAQQSLIVKLFAPPLVAVALSLSPMTHPPVAVGQTVYSQKGAVIFQRSCIGCHDGGGNIIQPGSTLFSQDLIRNGIDTEEEIYRVTYYGKARMPGFGESCSPRGQCTFGPRLTEDEIKLLAQFVKAQADQGWPKVVQTEGE